jgi:hypothetical protein
LPATQFPQVAPADALIVPETQYVHTVPAVGLDVPETQLVHVPPAALMVPAAQLEQEALPAALD